MAREWKWWYSYGERFRPADYRYDPERDWATVDQGLNAKSLYPLGFFQVKEYQRRGDWLNLQRKGKTFHRWVWTPHPQRHVRVFWGKLDRALKRLYEHGLIFTYAHTKGGYLSVTTFEDRPRHKMPEKRPVFGRQYNYGNTVDRYCPSETSVEERAQDKRLGQLNDPWDNYRKTHVPDPPKSGTESCAPRERWLDMLAVANATNPEHRFYEGYDLKTWIGISITKEVLKKREHSRIMNVQTLKHESNGGACSTWTSMQRHRNYRKNPKVTFEPRDIKLSRIRRERELLKKLAGAQYVTA